MDTDQLISASRSRFDHTAAKRTLREKYASKMIFAYSGGMWRAGPELHTMISGSGQTGHLILPDLYGNPVRVDANELLTLSQQRWQEQMNAWFCEHEELNSKR